MKQHYQKKKYSVKKSSGVKSTELLKTLQKIINTLEGSVSYVFLDERIQNIHATDLKDMKTVDVKSMLHVNLTEQSLFKKSPNDIIQMLETTKEDLGANYYILA